MKKFNVSWYSPKNGPKSTRHYFLDDVENHEEQIKNEIISSNSDVTLENLKIIKIKEL